MDREFIIIFLNLLWTSPTGSKMQPRQSLRPACFSKSENLYLTGIAICNTGRNNFPQNPTEYAEYTQYVVLSSVCPLNSAD